MSFQIFYRCAYYPQEDHEIVRPRTQDEWNAYKFCIAVKRATVNGYFHTKDPVVKINARNIARARLIFGEWLMATMKSNFNNVDRLVPVPSKDSWNTDVFRTLGMVLESVHDQDRALISPLVRFTVERQPASEGGPRGYDANYPYLAVTQHTEVKRVILVDDIVTSGGNVLAARQRLIEAGIEVLGAIVAGRTTRDQADPWVQGSILVPDGARQVP